jgi:hypothetical protein
LFQKIYQKTNPQKMSDEKLFALPASMENPETPEIKIGSFVRVKNTSGFDKGVVGRVKRIFHLGLDIDECTHYIDLKDVEPFENVNSSVISTGDIVRCPGKDCVGELVQATTKVVYHVKHGDGTVHQYEDIFSADKEAQKAFITARCEHLRKNAENAHKNAIQAQKNAIGAKDKVQETMQESTAFLTKHGSALDPKDFCALTNTLLADK